MKSPFAVRSIVGAEFERTVFIQRVDVTAPVVLQDDGTFAVEAVQTIDVAAGEDAPKLRFRLSADLGRASGPGGIGDTLLVYVADAAQTSNTYIDRGVPGTSVFSLSADSHELIPGVVQFDGSTVEADLSGLEELDQISVVFQLLNTNGLVDSSVSIDAIEIVNDAAVPEISRIP